MGRAQTMDVGDEFIVMKVASSNGDVLWMKLLGGPDGLEDRGWDIVVGPDDHPVVTGMIAMADGTANFYTAKLDNADGATIWSRSLPGANNNTGERAGWLGVFANGDIAMTNKTWDSQTSYDVVVHRYAEVDGATVYAVQHGTVGGSADDPRHMTVDKDENILVGGVHAGDFLVMKVDGQSGDLLWSGSYDGPAGAYDAANWVTEGPGGVIVAAGFSTGIGTSWDATLVGFDSVDGSVVWDESFDAGDHLADEAALVIPDPMGDLYVVGYGYTFASDSDLLTLRYTIDTTQGIEEPLWVGEPMIASPNPFSPMTRLSFESRPFDENLVTIYGPEGREVRRMPFTSGRTGWIEIVWDGRDNRGSTVPPGVYFAQVRAREGTLRCKMIRSR